MANNKLILNIFAFAVFAVISTQNNAATITRDFTGNDCSGYFGTGFDSCTIFVNSNGETIELSPVISKYNGDLSLSEVNNTVFPSVDGSEFTFSNTSAGNKTGSWSYTPGNDDPGVRYWATKAGNAFTLSWEVDDLAVASGGACDVSDVYVLSCLDAAQVVTTADWTTPNNKDLSHITFYDTGVTGTGTVPVPAAIWLFASGLLGLAAVTRRRYS